MIFLSEDYWKKIPQWKDVDSKSWRNWKWQIKNRIKKPDLLKKLLNLKDEEYYEVLTVSTTYNIGTTPYYISLIDNIDNSYGILRQIVPSYEEIDPEIQKNGDLDPFNEEISEVEGITHRYKDRVLFRVTNFCSVYCRHCMRKRIFLENKRAKKKQEIDMMVDYIKKNKDIREVLISGGDPLTLPNMKLEYILKKLYQLDHIDVIRIGTRELVVNPFRFFDNKLLEILDRYDKVWIVTHFNHPNEITTETKKAVKNILKTGTPVLNQTVLLKGINNSPEIIERLMRSLLKVKIKPYYLFFCDPTKGVLHFRTTIESGLEILRHLHKNLTGIGIPTFAVDLPGGMGKIPILPNYVFKVDESGIIFKNPDNRTVKTDIKWG